MYEWMMDDVDDGFWSERRKFYGASLLFFCTGLYRLHYKLAKQEFRKPTFFITDPKKLSKINWSLSGIVKEKVALLNIYIPEMTVRK